ncbi:hypothetical protein E2C01_057999 [Portunus trituberculatus]|uniref:Uncharacterized protein n=1 Tax=Portunus trituberculatus TaxID=210409 RepID=A0A5B7GUG1_PORTR|nr:hypothetical protein [Portunus trituberculatus]
MLLSYHLCWAALITISFLYFVLFFQSFLRIPQTGGGSGIMPIFPGMITVSVSETHLFVLNA